MSDGGVLIAGPLLKKSSHRVAGITLHSAWKLRDARVTKAAGFEYFRRGEAAAAGAAPKGALPLAGTGAEIGAVFQSVPGGARQPRV